MQALLDAVRSMFKPVNIITKAFDFMGLYLNLLSDMANIFFSACVVIKNILGYTAWICALTLFCNKNSMFIQLEFRFHHLIFIYSLISVVY